MLPPEFEATSELPMAAMLLHSDVGYGVNHPVFLTEFEVCVDRVSFTGLVGL